MTTTMMVSATIEIPMKRLVGALCSGIEGGIGYWAGEIFATLPDGFDRASFNAAHPELRDFTDAQIAPFVGGYFEVTDYAGSDREADELRVYRVDLEAIRRGLVAMTTPENIHHLADLISGNDDAITGDVFIQCSALGEVVYG